MTDTGEQARAVILALLMVVSVVGGSLAFGGMAAADGSTDADIERPEQSSSENSVASASAPEVEGVAASDSVERSEESLDISPAVRRTLQQSSPSERVPVILIFETQPEDQLPLDRMTAAEAQRDMESLAENSQEPTLEYLNTQATRGRAANIQPLYLRNAIAVEANEAVIRELAETQRIERVILDSTVSTLDGPGSSGLDEFQSELNESSNVTIDPTGFERVVESEPARGIEEIQADSVQDAGITGDGVNVSVIDSGINDSHPALEGQVVLRKNFVSNETNVGDPDGHGTHVAGTIAGRTDAEQAVGVAPKANLFDARVLDATGSGRISDIIRGFEWSANNSADVASASLGLDPIADDRETRIQVDNETAANISFEVYSNTSALNNTSVEGFRPAYVFVRADNVTVTNDSAAVDRTAAVENLSVTLRDPSGNETLERNNAGFVYPNGTVPDDQLLFKFTPSTARKIADGNWTLTVTNGNTDTAIEVDVDTVPVYPPDGTDQVSQAVDNLESTGTIPVVAAGNAGVLGNRTLASPAAAENAITVGASNPNTIDVAPFSSRGPVGFENEMRPGVDLIAPGVEIVSAGSPQAYAGEEPYVSQTGTSMAAPHVSGTIALLLDADPSLSRSDVEATLESTAQSPPAGENAVGAGALDAYAAVNSVTSETLTANQSVDSGIELYAGLGNTSNNFLEAPTQPDRDPVGDAGTAPDIEAAAVNADDFGARFEIALADNTAPNATFVTYIDADQNSSTGDTDQSGAEYRLNLTRTFNNTTGYAGSLDAFEFNETTGEYEPTDLGGSVNDDEFGFRERPQYVEYSVEVDPGIGTSQFDWHVVSQDPDSSSVDRLPDTGQVDTNYTADINGVGVAWNSTAGTPAADSPLQFRLYNESGALVSNRTVRTAADGLAETTFRSVSGLNKGYTLEIESERGSLIQQEIYFFGPTVDEGPGIDLQTQTADFIVTERDYDIRPNDQLELNIPVYSVNNGSIDPYEGPASIRFDGANQQTVNNLTVDNGTLTYTIDSATDPAFDSEYNLFVDFRIALTTDYSNASSTYEGGNIYERADVDIKTSIFPDAQVTPPRTTTNITFQTIEERPSAGEQGINRTPSEVNATYEITWITDRVVASFYRELPDSVATTLASARQTPGQPNSLTSAERDAIDAALENISDQGAVSQTVTGTATPERQGIGRFNVTPPEDARVGFVSVTPNNPELSDEKLESQTTGDEAIVFVDQRVDLYQRTPTAPQQEERFDVDVETFWPSQEIEDGVFVPNESIEVTVTVRDQVEDGPVPNTDVVLYTTGGETTTVTTDANGVAETTIPAPNLDYRNVSFAFEQQQVLGIAEGLQTRTGRSVSDSDTAFGDAFTTDGTASDSDSSSGVFADPSLSYNDTNERLTLNVTYRNGSTFGETNATTSLVLLGTPDATFDTQRDVFSGYLGSDTSATTVSRTFTEPVSTDQSKRYEVITRTPAGFEDFDDLFLRGINTDIEAPAQIQAGQSETVTVALTNRVEDPVANATVALYYTELDSQGTVTTAGDAMIGTTNASGVATFTISPDLADELDRGTIRLQAGYATDTAVDSRADTEFTQVVSDVTITGSIQYNNRTAAAGTNVTAIGGDNNDIVRTTQTNDTGAFDLAVPQGAAYDLVFSQDEPVTDGVPDLYTFASTGVIESDTDVRLTTLPAGNETAVQVTDQDDDPVADARVGIISHGTQPFDPKNPGVAAETTDQGRLNVTGNAVELANNITFVVAPPADSDVFLSDLPEYRQQRNITADTSVNLTLVRDTTGPTVRVDAPDTVNVSEQFVVDASDSTDNGTGIANYTFELPDGTNTTQSDPQLEVAFSDTGVKDITVTVTDNAGNQNNTTVAVEVVDSTGDDGGDNDGGGGGDDSDTTPPVVRVDAPSTVNVSEPFTIDASASVDSGSGIANYTFAVPNQANTTQSSPQFETNFSETGTQNITVTVTDAAGNQNSTTIDVEVVQSTDDGSNGGGGSGDPTTITETETGSEAPGFGPIVTLAALLSAALLALRRRTD